MHLFNNNSYFDIRKAAPSDSGGDIMAPIGSTTKKVEVTIKQIEDWSYRIQQAANEAGDGRLLALESDLLDLRDELVHELHSAL